MKKLKIILITLSVIVALSVALAGCTVIVTGSISGWGWKGEWDAVYNGSADISADYFYLKNASSTSIYHFKISIGDNEPTSWDDITTDQLSSNILESGQTVRWDVVNDWNANGLDVIWFKASAALDSKYIIGAFVYEDSYGWRLTVKD